MGPGQAAVRGCAGRAFARSERGGWRGEGSKKRGRSTGLRRGKRANKRSSSLTQLQLSSCSFLLPRYFFNFIAIEENFLLLFLSLSSELWLYWCHHQRSSLEKSVPEGFEICVAFFQNLKKTRSNFCEYTAIRSRTVRHRKNLDTAFKFTRQNVRPSEY